MRPIHYVGVVVLAALVGFTVFGVTVWNAGTLERVEPRFSTPIFDEVRERYAAREPLLRRDGSGRLVPHPESAPAEPDAIHRLVVYAYRENEEALARVRIPMWFFGLKEPALRFVLRRTGIDLEELGVTADQLRAFGPGVILDETDEHGDHVLIWTE